MKFELVTKVEAMSLLERTREGLINNQSNKYVIDTSLRNRPTSIVLLTHVELKNSPYPINNLTTQ